jgi:hypothetical protein
MVEILRVQVILTEQQARLCLKQRKIVHGAIELRLSLVTKAQTLVRRSGIESKKLHFFLSVSHSLDQISAEQEPRLQQ